MPRSFSFPVLDKKEICKSLSDLGAPKLSVENLSSPSSEALLPVYDFLVSFLLAESREESIQPGFEAIQMLGDYPEMHSESYTLMQSFTRLKKFMTAAGAEDFSVLKDLFRPESQRTIKYLSAAINFIMYSNQKVAFVVQLNKVRDEEIAKLEEVSEERSKVESEIAQIEQERVAVHPQVEALETETKELNNRIQALNKQQHGMQLDINNLKQEDTSILDKISNIDFEIMQNQQEGARIRSQIVENPQELQRTLQEKKSALAEEEAQGKKDTESCETWKAKVEVITKADKKILKLQRTLQSLEEQVNDRSIDKTLKERKARLKAIEKEEWSLEAKKDELQWGVPRLEELVEKHSQQCNAALKDLKAMKAKQEQCRAEHDAERRALTEQDNQIEALQKMDADILIQKTTKISQVQACAGKLMAAAMKIAGG